MLYPLSYGGLEGLFYTKSPVQRVGNAATAQRAEAAATRRAEVPWCGRPPRLSHEGSRHRAMNYACSTTQPAAANASATLRAAPVMVRSSTSTVISAYCS